MKAIVQNAYGSPAVLELKEVERPLVKDDGVLVRVYAAALHAGDYFMLRGSPYLARAFMRSFFVRQQGRPFLSTPNHEDMALLKGLVEGGKMKPVIDRTYRLSETPEALGYVAEGHVRGKVVIAVSKQGQPEEAAALHQHPANGAVRRR